MHLIYQDFSFVTCVLMSYQREHCLIYDHEDLFLFSEFYNFSSCIQVCDPFLVSFCLWCKEGDQLLFVFVCLFACGYTVDPALFIEKANFFSIELNDYIWKLYSMIFLSFLRLLPHGLNYSSFVVRFELGKYESSDFVFFIFKIIFAVLGALHFRRNSRISRSISAEKLRF